MVDWERLEELCSEIGEESFREVVGLFLEEVESTLERLDRFSPALEQDFHFLKGSAWNLGFRTFAEFAQSGERLASAGRGAEADLASFRAVYAASRGELLGGLDGFLHRCGGAAA